MQALYPGETVLRPKKKFAGSSGALPLVSANTISTAIYGLLLVGLPNGRFHYRRHGVNLAEPAKYDRSKLILKQFPPDSNLRDSQTVGDDGDSVY